MIGCLTIVLCIPLFIAMFINPSTWMFFLVGGLMAAALAEDMFTNGSSNVSRPRSALLHIPNAPMLALLFPLVSGVLFFGVYLMNSHHPKFGLLTQDVAAKSCFGPNKPCTISEGRLIARDFSAPGKYSASPSFWCRLLSEIARY